MVWFITLHSCMLIYRGQFYLSKTKTIPCWAFSGCTKGWSASWASQISGLSCSSRISGYWRRRWTWRTLELLWKAMAAIWVIIKVYIYIYGYESKYKVWIKAPDPHTIHTPRSIPWSIPHDTAWSIPLIHTPDPYPWSVPLSRWRKTHAGPNAAFYPNTASGPCTATPVAATVASTAASFASAASVLLLLLLLLLPLLVIFPPRSCCYCCRFCCCSCWSCSRCWCWFTSSECFW